MTDKITSTEQTYLWECPYPDCSVTVIGRFGSLRQHVRGDHPLWSCYDEDPLEEVHQELLQSRIESEMMASCADTKSNDGDGNCGDTNGGKNNV